MLTKEQIAANKQRYVELISSITLEGANVKGFLNWLYDSDFFEAPASSKYHCDYAGGLCEHSLHVYDNLVSLVKNYANKFENTYSEDVIKIVALLHDISKTNLYEMYDKNVKDEFGHWIKISNYKVRETADRFVYGSHEQTAEFMASTFFPLDVEARTAILHHHGGMSWDSAKDDVGAVYGRFPLALLLHTADMLSTFLDEGSHESAD